MNRIGCVIGFLWVVLAFYGQENPRLFLYQKADSLLEAGNYTQANYFFRLSFKQSGNDPSSATIKKAIFKVDSIEAYASDDKEYLSMLSKAEEAFTTKKEILAIKLFDDAYNFLPAYHYPQGRIEQIIEGSEQIKKQLLIYQAKQNQLSFQKVLNDVAKLESEGWYIEAYFNYVELIRLYHNDSSLTIKKDQLWNEHAEKIQKFESHVLRGENLFQKGEYKKARIEFELAYALNPKCSECEARLDHITFYIQHQEMGKRKYDELVEDAVNGMNEGNYEKAYYELYWLSKQYPQDEKILGLIDEVQAILDSEVDDRNRLFNAEITLEKANEAFLALDYQEALTNYLKIKNAYADVVDYLQFVELRIAECLSELEQ